MTREENKNYIDYVSNWIDVNGEKTPKPPDERIVGKLKQVEQGKHPFSVFGLIFGPLYYLYRKCYLHAVIFFCVGFAIQLLDGLLLSITTEGMYNAISIAVSFIYMIVLGFAFYPLYRKDLIRRGKNNLDPQKRGGTSFVPVAVVLAVILFLFIFGGCMMMSIIIP